MHLAGGNYKEPGEGIQVKHKDATKSAREFMGVRPPTRAQSNNKPKKSSTSSIACYLGCNEFHCLEIEREYFGLM